MREPLSKQRTWFGFFDSRHSGTVINDIATKMVYKMNNTHKLNCIDCFFFSSEEFMTLGKKMLTNLVLFDWPAIPSNCDFNKCRVLIPNINTIYFGWWFKFKNNMHWIQTSLFTLPFFIQTSDEIRSRIILFVQTKFIFVNVLLKLKNEWMFLYKIYFIFTATDQNSFESYNWHGEFNQFHNSSSQKNFTDFLTFRYLFKLFSWNWSVQFSYCCVYVR